MPRSPLQRSALAQTYPAKPIELVVPFSPGGASDLTARTLAQKMGESMGQSIVVDNKPGANGVLGIDVVAKVAARRLHDPAHRSRLAHRQSEPVREAAVRPASRTSAYIGIATDGPYVLVANPKLGVKTVQELVALSKSKPGTLNYASFGIGSMAQLNLEAFNQKMGTDMLHVPYKGAAPAAQAAVAGEVGVTIAAVPAVQGFIKDGRLRALAVGVGQALCGAARRADDDRGRRRQRHPGADLLRAARARGHAAARSSRGSTRR